MNNKIIGFCALAICYGCKVNKEKSERIHTDSQSRSSLEANTSWTQFNSRDSSYRFWHYAGDSSFFFHPDLGLWSSSGQIVYGEKRTVATGTSGLVLTYDSMAYESNNMQQDTFSKRNSYPLLSWIWLLFVIPIGALIYRWWK